MLTLLLVGAGFLYARHLTKRQEHRRFFRDAAFLFHEMTAGQLAYLNRLEIARFLMELNPTPDEAWPLIDEKIEWQNMRPWLRQFGWVEVSGTSAVVRFLAEGSEAAPLRQGEDLQHGPIFQDAIRMATTTRKHGITQPMPIPPTQGEDRLGVVLFIPVFARGETAQHDGPARGYIAATIDPVGLFAMPSRQSYRILNPQANPPLSPTNCLPVKRILPSITLRLLPKEPAPGEYPPTGWHPVRGDNTFGRTLHYSLSPSSAFFVEQQTYLPLAVLWGGLTTGLAFFLIIVFQTHQRLVAEKRAREMAEQAQALRTSEGRFRALIENCFDVILVLNPDGSPKYIGPSGARMFAYPADDAFMQTGISKVIHPDDLPLIIEAHRKIIEQPDRIQRVPCYRGLGLDGAVYFLEAIGTNCLNVPGVEGIVINIRDITERKQADDRLREANRELEERVAQRTEELREVNRRLEQEIREKRMFHAVVAATSDLVGMASLEGQGIYMNPSGRRMLGIEPDEDVTALSMWPSYAPDQLQMLREVAVPHAMREGSWCGDLKMLRRDGSELMLSVGGVVIRDEVGRPLHLANIARDISDRLKTEERLRGALQAEKELNQLKSNFVAMVSHEIRTPLATILSSVDLLQNYSDRLPPEHRAKLLRHIHDAALGMASNMENILLLSRMDAGRFVMQTHRIPLADLCRQIANETESAYRRHTRITTTIEPDADLEVSLDPNLFRNILSNILGNALKFSPPDTAVQFAVARAADEVLFTVRDHGPGIPEADRANLFQAFRRGSNISGIPGTGLGLVIVKRCVDLLQGVIAIESEPGQGTVVHLRIPLFNRTDKEAP